MKRYLAVRVFEGSEWDVGPGYFIHFLAIPLGWNFVASLRTLFEGARPAFDRGAAYVVAPEGGFDVVDIDSTGDLPWGTLDAVAYLQGMLEGQGAEAPRNYLPIHLGSRHNEILRTYDRQQVMIDGDGDVIFKVASEHGEWVESVPVPIDFMTDIVSRDK